MSCVYRRTLSGWRASVVAMGALALGVAVHHGAPDLAPAATGDTVPRPSPQLERLSAGDTIGLADGVLPEGATVFDSEYPGVSRLDPGLLRAVRRAAAASGAEVVVNSGWRSARYQEQLFDQAVIKYGSRAAASRWVASPERSAHVSGDAVDIGPAKVAAWLSRHGAAYGLCRTYRNEPWHFELRADAAKHGCPAMYTDAAHDERR
jgi:hypothetical protein